MKQPPKRIGLYIRTLKNGVQKYESRLWNPHLKRIGKKKLWQEKDLTKVIQLHARLKQDYETNGYEIIRSIPDTPTTSEVELLLEAAAYYERYLNDDKEIVLNHERKNRDKDYIKDLVHYIRTFLKVLQQNGIEVSRAHVSVISPQAVSYFHSYLQLRYEAGEIGPVTWNKHMTACKYWVKFLQLKGIVQDNPFTSVKLKREPTDPQFAEIGEIETLISIITPENGIGTKGVRRIETVNFFRPWLADYLLGSVLIGGRPGEIAELRWSSIANNYVTIDNNKINRAKNEQSNVNYVYINPELALLLAKLSKDQNEADGYVFVPEHTNRKSLRSFVAKAFKHYWKQVNPDKDLSLNNLRHTYINAIYNRIGEKGLSVHNKKETAIKHYLSKKKRLDLEEGQVLFGFDQRHFES